MSAGAPFVPAAARAAAAAVAFPNPSSGGSGYLYRTTVIRAPLPPRRRSRRRRTIAPKPFTIAEVTVVVGKRPIRGNWWASARCRNSGVVSLFFPEVGENAHDAKAFCVECRTRANCLLYALNHKEHFGVWGGLSERERRNLRRRRGKAPANDTVRSRPVHREGQDPARGQVSQADPAA